MTETVNSLEQFSLGEWQVASFYSQASTCGRKWAGPASSLLYHSPRVTVWLVWPDGLCQRLHVTTDTHYSSVSCLLQNLSLLASFPSSLLSFFFFFETNLKRYIFRITSLQPSFFKLSWTDFSRKFFLHLLKDWKSPAENSWSKCPFLTRRYKRM